MLKSLNKWMVTIAELMEKLSANISLDILDSMRKKSLLLFRIRQLLITLSSMSNQFSQNKGN